MYLISPATPADVPALAALVNSAYRGEQSKAGWTTEADLISGKIRIDEQELQQQIGNQSVTLLLYRNEQGMPLGSVYLERKGKKLYLGLLSVKPELQGAGIGKKLLAAAEAYAKKNDCDSIFMTVILQRTELVDWYVRHGYRNTGEKRPFPAGNKFGEALVPLEFVVLEKMMK